jgi:hypothetical protein
MLPWLKRVSILVAVFLVAIQFFPPARTNPPTEPNREIQTNLAVDPAIAGIFQRSCNDCHSNHTVWPWYSRVAPVS